MEFFDLNNLHLLTSYLHEHPHIGAWITFGIAFLESLAVIGGIVPGSVTMTVVGTLIGSGSLPLGLTIVSAIIGAFCGDFLSYGVGAYYNDRLRNIWPFRKYPQWISKGEDFFQRHGGKSVVIGRFFGPVRSLVPLIAGLLHMKPLRFGIATFIAAALWSVVYIFPGIIIGALSLELPPATATKFILITLALVAFGWVIFIIIHVFFKTLVNSVDRLMARSWQALSQCSSTRWITSLLSDSHKANPHRQLTLLLFVGLFGVIFCLLLYSMITHGSVTQLNQPVFELLRSLRTRVGDDIFLSATLLGNKYVQLSAGVLIFAALFLKRYYAAACYWLGVVFLSAGTAQAVKLLYYSPRPTGLLNPQLTSSFPSGHAILSVALFSFLAMLIARELREERRKIPYLLAALFATMVIVSRIYLGAHWLTDVAASVCLGLACALFVNLLYLRRERPKLPARQISIITVGIFLVLWLIYGVSQFRTQQDDYTLYWPTATMESAEWWRQPHAEVPLFVLSRLGKPSAALNVQWLGDVQQIETLLTAKGWQSHPIQVNWKGRLSRFSDKANPEHLPVLPALYQNQSPVLLMTKSDTDPNQLPLYFVLWKSNVTIPDSQYPLWIGSVHYYMPRIHKDATQLSKADVHQRYAKAMHVFIADLNNEVEKKAWKIPQFEEPPIMLPLHWNGELLLVRPR